MEIFRAPKIHKINLTKLLIAPTIGAKKITKKLTKGATLLADFSGLVMAYVFGKTSEKTRMSDVIVRVAITTPPSLK